MGWIRPWRGRRSFPCNNISLAPLNEYNKEERIKKKLKIREKAHRHTHRKGGVDYRIFARVSSSRWEKASVSPRYKVTRRYIVPGISRLNKFPLSHVSICLPAVPSGFITECSGSTMSKKKLIHLQLEIRSKSRYRSFDDGTSLERNEVAF